VALLQRAMALVHPTPVDADGSAGWHELFGLAIVEAMACGCPVIASATASLSEIVEDGVSGVLVPPNEPSAIAGAITSLSRNTTFWQRASAGARFRAESVFSWERVVDRALAAYANTSSWQTSPAEVSGATLS
jgi:glycosyltransferase involved in cell wall biosynthesis